jgi:hypothetical protein
VRSARLCNAASNSGEASRLTERFDADAVRAEKIERHVNPIEIAVVGLAILQMIDDLQRSAQRIVGRPGAALSPCTSSTKRPTGIADSEQ